MHQMVIRNIYRAHDMITFLTFKFRPNTGKVVFLILTSACILYFLVVTRGSLTGHGPKEAKRLTGLEIKGTNFTMEGKPFRILSGALHYFRVPQQHWQDRIMKLKAMGLNTVETYVPWNMHEPEPGVFDFTDMLDVSSFLHLAKSYGLYVILRPGPYICTEWDLGGLPSWLLRDKNMKLRSMYKPFLAAADKYLNRLAVEVKKHQFSDGGPVIAIQVENEYGSYGDDSTYMETMKEIFIKNGLHEFLFICDNNIGLGKYKLDGVLQTVNFQTEVSVLEKLRSIQPNKPLFVTEFWIGWFDHWGEKHHKVKSEVVSEAFEKILSMGASFNFYMFHGGTNFGFMNGANANDFGQNYKADTTSYDYDSPVSELGELTPKFFDLRNVLKKNIPKDLLPDKFPWVQEESGRTAFGEVKVNAYMSLDDMLHYVSKDVKSDKVMSMEELPINNDAGQSYGYILYQTSIPSAGRKLTIYDVRDHTLVLIDGKLVEKTSYGQDKFEVKLPESKKTKDRILRILVENCGRVNYDNSMDKQRKGILGHVSLDEKEIKGWQIYPLEFKYEFLDSLTSSNKWNTVLPKQRNVPTVYRANLYVHHRPWDTLLKFKGWTKGAVFVNKINIGRYWNEGPQTALYLPGPWLQAGDNSVIIFEQHSASSDMKMESVAESPFTATTYFQL